MSRTFVAYRHPPRVDDANPPHAECFDCGTATCPDCRAGKHRSCYGPPCACTAEHPQVTP